MAVLLKESRKFSILKYTKNKPKGCCNTVPALTKQPNKEAVMADSKVRNSTTQEQEIWKPVKGYEGLYEVSNHGRVKSLERFRDNGNGGYVQSESILKPAQDRNGYWRVMLTKNKKGRPRLVHRLIAQAFIPNPENKRFVNHINGDSSDFRLINLEWCTHAENMSHAFQTGLINNSGENNGMAKLTNEKVKIIREKYSTGNYTQRELGKIFNVGNARICNIVNYKAWTEV